MSLVINRNEGEKIIILDGLIEIEILAISGGIDGGRPKVRVGITAPTHISIDREEVFVRKDRDARRAEETDATRTPKGPHPSPRPNDRR